MKVRDPAMRPDIPLVLGFALVFWLGVALLWQACFSWKNDFRLACVAAGAIVLAIYAAKVARKKWRNVLPAAFVLALMLCCAQTLNVSQAREAYSATGEQDYTFLVVEDEREGTYSASCIAYTQHAGAWVKVRVYIGESQGLLYGQRFNARALLKAPSETALESCNKKGVVFTARVSNLQPVEHKDVLGVLSGVRAHSIDVLEAQTNEGQESSVLNLLNAVLFAKRSELYESTFYQDVKCCGLAHLVAVSGAHLVIISGFVSALLGSLRCPKRLSVLLQVAFLLAYLVMVGVPPSCLRAATMALLAHVSSLSLHRSSALNSLGVALLLFIGFDPSLALSLSLQLSALATLGILVLMPLLNNWLEQLQAPLPSVVAEPLIMTIAATIPTIPLTCATFAQFPLLAPLANVVATPFLTLICTLGVLAFFLQPIAVLFSALTQMNLAVAQAFCCVVGAGAAVPYSCVPVSVGLDWAGPACVGLMFGLWYAWPTLNTRSAFAMVGTLLITALLLVNPFTIQQERLVMLDVGQGDAFLLQSEGHSLLVDTGNQPRMLLSGLARAQVNNLDAVLITHADDDHCASLTALRNVVSVEEVVVAYGLPDVHSNKTDGLMRDIAWLGNEAHVATVVSGDVLQVGKWKCRVLWPEGEVLEAGNAESICMLAECDQDGDGITDWKAFFCGDAEQDTLEKLIASGQLGDIDIYKVGHHGSKVAITEQQALTLSPQVSLVSVGEGNSYGHPAPNTVEALRQAGSVLYRTDENSDVVCSFTPAEMRVSTLR